MDGVLVVDKPKNMTSHDVVNIARKALGTKRIGHTGTLDPNATGLLILAVGKATKLVKYFTEDRKTYEGTILIGQGYDTDDVTGKLINEIDASSIPESKIREILETFIGKQKQIPPAYSAIKIQGQKLYELARKNIVMPHVEPRDVEVFNIDNVGIIYLEKTIEIKLRLDVSKGTYIRSIARDLGEQLGNCGSLIDLRRIKINRFNIDEAYTIEQLQKEGNQVVLKEPFEYLDLPSIIVDKNVENDINFGRFIELDFFKEKTDTIIYSLEKEPLAIYYYDEVKNIMRMSVKWC